MVDGTFTVGEFLLFVFYLSRVMLTITDLAYGYPGSENGIVNINLTLPCGSLKVITGRIGSASVHCCGAAAVEQWRNHVEWSLYRRFRVSFCAPIGDLCRNLSCCLESAFRATAGGSCYTIEGWADQGRG